MKDSWQTISQLLDLSSQSTNIVSLKESNQVIFDNQSISNRMNEYFCSIGEKLAADIVHTSNPLLSKEISINSNGKIFDFREISEGDILEAIYRIRIKKSIGNDNIFGRILKIAFSYISRILMLIFNTSIETSSFPVSWKIARVTQIYIEGEKSERSNYRPISVLPVLSRLFEKQVPFLLAGRLLELPKFTKKVKSQKGQVIDQYRCYLVYLGFSRNKGGSVLPRLIPISCLYKYLPCIVKKSKVSMYADDTGIYHSSKDITQLNTALNEELRRPDRWLKGNKLSLNVNNHEATEEVSHGCKPRLTTVYS